MHKIIALSALRKTGAKRSEKRRVIQRILTHMSEDSFCIAPPKKISPENPYGTRDFGVF